MWVLIHGNPLNGFKYIGPFKSKEKASDWFVHNVDVDEADWWVAELKKPE